MAQASSSEFVINGHYYTSPNQQTPPPTLPFSDSESLPDDVSPSQLRNRVWALFVIYIMLYSNHSIFSN